MRGTKPVKKREILPDSKYNSTLVAKFINQVMRRGKKSTAEKIVYSAFALIEQKTKKPAIEVLEKALDNAGPILEVRPRRIGGATYQVPLEVSRDRKITLAMRWIISAARARQGKPMFEFLAQELLDAYHNEGVAVKKKEDTHRMAEANRAFAHYARM
jgi:small subunit ribosomal protein S7